MKKIIFSVLVACILFPSCTKNEIKIDKNNLLIGTWVYSHYTGSVAVYSRAMDFTQATGFKFMSDGTCIERNLSGLCATPPVSYSDYSGTWTVLKDNLLEINRTNFDGLKSYTLNIQSVNSDSLKILLEN